MLDFIVEKNLNLQNRGTEPTFVTNRSETIIDLTLTGGNSLDYLKNWRVTNSISLSDHRHIQFEISEAIAQTAKFRNKESTNWAIYQIRLRENLINVRRNPQSLLELDRFATDLKEAIVEAFYFACPEKTQSQGRKNVPWWTKN